MIRGDCKLPTLMPWNLDEVAMIGQFVYELILEGCGAMHPMLNLFGSSRFGGALGAGSGCRSVCSFLPVGSNPVWTCISCLSILYSPLNGGLHLATTNLRYDEAERFEIYTWSRRPHFSFCVAAPASITLLYLYLSTVIVTPTFPNSSMWTDGQFLDAWPNRVHIAVLLTIVSIPGLYIYLDKRREYQVNG